MTRGPLLFARFAFPPNRLGYCGPSDHQGLFEMATAAAPAAELAAMARAFEGAYPYLQLIAASNGIADPLDARVVEAYWVGSPLLDQVEMTAMGAALDERFRPRVASRTWSLLAEAVPAGAVPHHSFHVFGVYPWVGLIREGQVDQPLRVLDQCRIRWGVVRRVEGDQAVVSSRPLVWDGRALGYGPLRRGDGHLGPRRGGPGRAAAARGHRGHALGVGLRPPLGAAPGPPAPLDAAPPRHRQRHHAPRPGGGAVLSRQSPLRAWTWGRLRRLRPARPGPARSAPLR